MAEAENDRGRNIKLMIYQFRKIQKKPPHILSGLDIPLYFLKRLILFDASHFEAFPFPLYGKPYRDTRYHQRNAADYSDHLDQFLIHRLP